MEYRRLQAEHQTLMRSLAREPLQYDSASDSDEGEEPPEDDPSADEEGENKENVPPASAWLPDTNNITLPPCTAHPTVVLPRHRARTELGYFRCFIPDTLIDMMVSNTNAYTQQLGATPLFVTDAAEMWRFIAARIRIGIARLPKLRMYWEAEYQDSYVTQLFTRDRFLLLQRYWHIAPPTPAGENHTVVEKISPLYHGCQDLFQAYYTPGTNFAVDESMVRCKGRTPWKTTIKIKPTETGYKMYTVGSDGYLLGFAIYRGKGGYDTPHAAIHHTVINLVRPWANCNRILYFDNLYTSPTLCDDLLQMGIRSCGICRANRRDLPPRVGVAMKRLDKDEHKAWQRGQLGCPGLAQCQAHSHSQHTPSGRPLRHCHSPRPPTRRAQTTGGSGLQPQQGPRRRWGPDAQVLRYGATSTAYVAVPGMVAARYVHCQRLRTVVAGHQHADRAASLPTAAHVPTSSPVPFISHSRAARHPTRTTLPPTRPLPTTNPSQGHVCPLHQGSGREAGESDEVRAVPSVSVQGALLQAVSCRAGAG